MLIQHENGPTLGGAENSTSSESGTHQPKQTTTTTFVESLLFTGLNFVLEQPPSCTSYCGGSCEAQRVQGQQRGLNQSGKASSCWTMNDTEVKGAQPELHLKHTHKHTIIEGGQW